MVKNSCVASRTWRRWAVAITSDCWLVSAMVFPYVGESGDERMVISSFSDGSGSCTGPNMSAHSSVFSSSGHDDPAIASFAAAEG